MDRKTYDALVRGIYRYVAAEAHANDAMSNDPTPENQEEARARTRTLAGFLVGARAVAGDDSTAVDFAHRQARDEYQRDRVLGFGLSYGLETSDIE